MAEPITTAEAKKHLRVNGSADDSLIGGYVAAARGWVEDYTGLVLAPREVSEALPRLGSRTRLRAWPIDVTASATIVYRDIDGAERTIGDAELVATTRPGLIRPAPGTRWPSDVGGDIAVTFTAGYADAADIPPTLKQAMLVMLTAFYEDREGGEMFAASEKSAARLCRRGKRWTL